MPKLDQDIFMKVISSGASQVMLGKIDLKKILHQVRWEGPIRVKEYPNSGVIG